MARERTGHPRLCAEAQNIKSSTFQPEKNQVTDLKPLVDTSSVKLVAAGQRTKELTTLKVAHADDARRLVEERATNLLVEAVTWQQVDVALCQSPWLRFTEPIRKIEQRLPCKCLHHFIKTQLLYHVQKVLRILLLIVLLS